MIAAVLAPSGLAATERTLALACHYFVAVADSGPRRRLNKEFRKPVENQTSGLLADLLREIFGNPFHPVVMAREWSSWRSATIPRAALCVYESRRFEDLPVLADALEEAGCTARDLLDHLRRPGEHVHGCWALDLALGR